MDFKDISGSFGGSILPDEHTPDIQGAKKKIGAFQLTGSAEDYIAVHLLQGLLSAAKGELASSVDFFRRASQAAQRARDTRLIARCEAYESLLFVIKADVPMAHFHDDKGGDWRKLSDAETRDFDRRVQFIGSWSTVWPSLTELERLERDVIAKFAQYCEKLQMAAFPHHPEYYRRKQDLFEARIPFPRHLADEAERVGLRSTARHMRRLNAQYLLAGASEQGTQELEQQYRECLDDGDFAGAASCRVILGDNRLSLPFSCLVVLNVCLMNRVSSLPGIGDWHDSLETGRGLRSDPAAAQSYQRAWCDSLETRRRLRADRVADQFYQRASALFDRAGSTRGRASVELRLGCVALAEYLNAQFLGGHQDTPVPQDHAGRALGHFNRAREQGVGDMVRLASAHLIILRILDACPPDMRKCPTRQAQDDAVQAAADIGTWGRSNANTGVVWLVGLLFLGVGRLLSAAPQNVDAASLCCACARSCFRGAGERILELHATIQHARLHQSHGNMDTARSYLDSGQSVLLDAVSNLVQPLVQTTAPHDYRRLGALKFIKTNMITGLNSAAAPIYANDPRGTAWAARMRELLPGRDGSATSAMMMSMMDMVMSLDGAAVAGTSLGAGGHGAPASVDAAESAPTRTAQTAQPAADTSSEPERMAKRLYAPFFRDLNAVSRIREEFRTAMGNRRRALVVLIDWEKGQEHLQGFLQRLDQAVVAGLKSAEVYSIRAATLYHLGRHDEIRQWLRDAVPIMFGGRLLTACDKFRRGGAGPGPARGAAGRQVAHQHGERSLSLCYFAQDWVLGAEVLHKIQQYAPELLDELDIDKGDGSWVNMGYIAAIEEHSGNLEASFRWRVKGVHMVESSRSKLSDVADRRALLDVIQSAELFAGLARLSLRFAASRDPERFPAGRPTEHGASHHPPTWSDKALHNQEQDRARAQHDQNTPEGMSEDFVRVLKRLQTLRREELEMQGGRATTDERRRDVDLAAYLERLGSGLRREVEEPSRAMILSRLYRPHFAASASCLYESIPENAITVHVNPSRDGVLILYITRECIQLVRHNAFTDQQMEKHVLRYLKLFTDIGRNANIDDLPSKVKCEALLEELSGEMIRPGLQHIDGKSHLIFVPSQSLNKFPFSALLLDGEPLFLQKGVSMVPSLSVLWYLVQTASDRPRDRAAGRACVIYRAPLRTDLSYLNNSAGAAIDIARRLGCAPEAAHKVNLEAFREAYKTSDVIAVCTHGLRDSTSAWKSNIELQEPLPVLELVPLRSRAALVVFQACVSGVGESSLGNDVLGFAHSVLSSGAGAFLGALWNVSDKGSALLMSFLFRELTGAAATAPAATSGAESSAGASTTLAACLRRAQIKLYQTDAPTAKAVLEDFGAACTALEAAGGGGG